MQQWTSFIHFLQKKAVFSLELHAALEEDKQLTEKLKNLRREQESIKTRTSELFGRNSTTVQSPSIDIDSLFTTLTANVYRLIFVRFRLQLRNIFITLCCT